MSSDEPGAGDEVVRETAVTYAPSQPVRVRVRRREHRYDVDDLGGAVAAAGTPDGWLSIAEAVVASDGLNVNRRGVVFVPAVEGRDIDALVARVARASLALHGALLELDA